MERDPIEEIARQAERSSYRFSRRAFDQWLDHAGRPLAEAFQAAPWPDEAKRALFDSALRLAAEAVSCGYLAYRPDGITTEEGWFNWTFGTLLGARLPRLSPVEAAAELAQLWNLAEGLELGPAWLRTLFELVRARLVEVPSVTTFLREIDEGLSPAGLLPLGSDPRTWRVRALRVAEGPLYARPGRAYLLAPRVVAVEERVSGGLSLFLLRPDPLPLGLAPRALVEAALPVDSQAVAVEGSALARLLERERVGELDGLLHTEHFWVASGAISERVWFAWVE